MQDRFRTLLARLSPLSAHFNSYSSSGYSYVYSNKYSSNNAGFYLYLLVQVAPLLVLLGLPALALFFLHYTRRRTSGSAVRRVEGKLVWFVCMVLETVFGVAIPLPWGWGAGSGNADANSGEGKAGEDKEKRKKRKEKGWRKRRSSQSTEVPDKESEESDDDEDLYYPGLVNISGTYCFLNSVLQATASLAYLQPYLDAIHTRAVDLDVPTPVVDTLQGTLQALNTPKSSRSSLRPVPMINALSQPAPGTRGRSKLFASREHQDAQELFQLLSECIKSEAQAVDAEAQRDRGLGSFASSSFSASSSSSLSSSSTLRGTDDGEVELSSTGVFDGLTANRRSCVACGYTEAVMHFAFATWSLALPAAGFGGSCALQECLSEYTRLELLTDCVCRRCSMRATYARVREEAERLAEVTRAGGPSATSQYKKKKAREARRMEKLVSAAIEAGRIEEDIRGVKMERVISSASTKQAMIARPPKILVLHLNRSLHFGGPYSSRNPIRVLFPEILDLTPYTTSGQLCTAPSSPISPPPPPTVLSIPRSTTPTQGLYTTPRVLYRLSAVVAHYGAHSFGHYVCFRRKPRVSRKGSWTSGTARMGQPSVPQMPCPYGCECTLCTTYGPVRDSPTSSSTSDNTNGEAKLPTYRPPKPGKGWLRISDDAVEECGMERVLAEGSGAFLLFYERVQVQNQSHPSSAFGLPQSYPYQQLQNASTVPSASIRIDGIGHPSGVGFGGGGGGRGLGSIYQHLHLHNSNANARGTPRSSEETVRPADVLSSSTNSSPSPSSSISIPSSISASERAASVSSSVSSSWSGSGSGWRDREKTVRPRVVRRTTAGRRERSREVEERVKGKENESEKGKGKGKGKEEEVLVNEEDKKGEVTKNEEGDGASLEGSKPTIDSIRFTHSTENGSKPDGNGSAIPLPLPNGPSNGLDGDARQVGIGEVDLDSVSLLSESIVKVELPLPSPPRTPSPGPGPDAMSNPRRDTEKEKSLSSPVRNSTNPASLPSSFSSQPQPQNVQRPTQIQTPRTPSPTPSPIPSTPSPPPSPAKRKTAKNRARAARKHSTNPTSSPSVSSNTSANSSSNSGGSGMLSRPSPADRAAAPVPAAVGLRA